jgi:pyrroloquinoline quinone biosynthesis protein E
MGGWGKNQLTVTPNGNVLPCPAAHLRSSQDHRARELACLDLARVGLFQRFRGTEWMPEPCQRSDRREVVFGGCRCQAFQLTGEAARTDPVCHRSPDHEIVDQVVRAAYREKDR